MKEETSVEVELAVRRILLMHGIILSIGGVPLIYLGDELGTLNDVSYLADPAKADDSRWVHRPRTDWDRAANRSDVATIEGQLYQRLRHLIDLRQTQAAFSGTDMNVIDTGSVHVFGFVRAGDHQQVIVLANFSERPQTVAAPVQGAVIDLISGQAVALKANVTLDAYQQMWLLLE